MGHRTVLRYKCYASIVNWNIMVNDIELACNCIKKALIESIHGASDNDIFVPCEFNSFPRGSCEVTSLWLAELLQRIGVNDIQICNGSRNLEYDTQSKNHVWLFMSTFKHERPSEKWKKDAFIVSRKS